MRHRGLSGRPRHGAASYRYFIEIVDRLQKVRRRSEREFGVARTPAHIADTLKKVEPPAFDE